MQSRNNNFGFCSLAKVISDPLGRNIKLFLMQETLGKKKALGCRGLEEGWQGFLKCIQGQTKYKSHTSLRGEKKEKKAGPQM